MIEKRFTAVIEWHATHRNRDHLRARCSMRVAHLIVTAILASADDQTRFVFATRDDQSFRRLRLNGRRHASNFTRIYDDPPPTKCTISSRSSSSSIEIVHFVGGGS